MYGQTDTIVRLSILTGSSLNYNFNSYTKLENGISSPYSTSGWTRFRVYVRRRNAGVVENAPWYLSVRSASADIANDIGGMGLALSTLRIRALATDPWLSLTATDQTIASGITNASSLTREITIYYECGVPPGCTTVMGQSDGYYYGDLIFTLSYGP